MSATERGSETATIETQRAPAPPAPKRARGLDAFRKQVRENLEQDLLEGALREIPPGELDALQRRYLPKARKRLWTVRIMIWFWLTSALDREHSFNAVANRLLTHIVVVVEGTAGQKISSGRLSEGRARIPVGLLHDIRTIVTQKVLQEGQDLSRWEGRRLLWLDGSTLCMEDVPELHEQFGAPSNQHGQTSFPVARVVNLGITVTRAVVDSRWGSYRTSEKELTIPLILTHLLPGDVLTGDCYYASAEILALVQETGADALMRKHEHLKVGNHPRRRIGPQDWVLKLLVPKGARAEHPHLPEEIEIRVFRIVVGHGKHRFELWIETTLLDPRAFPKEKLAAVYLGRYGAAETSYAELKTELHLAVLRSQTVAGVNREIEAHLIMYNYVRLEMLRAAQRAGVDPRQLSFLEAVRTLLNFAPELRRASEERRAQLKQRLWDQIGACRVVVRPGRHEPRAVKRPPKPFPRLKTSRADSSRRF